MLLPGVVLVLSTACFAQTLKPVEVVTTNKLDLGTGGSIKVVGSRGQLNIEAWDRPEVEITITRFTEREDKDRDTAKKGLEAMVFEAKKNGTNEIVITAPKERGPKATNVDYRIRAPKDANLNIEQRSGDVVITGMAGAITAHDRNGEIFVILPEAKAYSIEAKAKIGTVFCEFDGQRKRVFPMGSSFSGKSGDGAKPLVLETANGGVTVQKTQMGFN